MKLCLKTKNLEKLARTLAVHIIPRQIPPWRLLSECTTCLYSVWIICGLCKMYVDCPASLRYVVYQVYWIRAMTQGQFSIQHSLRCWHNISVPSFLMPIGNSHAYRDRLCTTYIEIILHAHGSLQYNTAYNALVHWPLGDMVVMLK